MTIHKHNQSPVAPDLSIILLDWSVRERFTALDWLASQDLDRARYELIWVELYERTPAEVMAKADVVVTCGQKGMYHKHKGYNAGLLCARGQVITVCDSDAVFPPGFVRSVLTAFGIENGGVPRPLVLYHWEWRTADTYPAELRSVKELQRHKWSELWLNAGACVSMPRADALHFGGFDEHRSYRGYYCGPYELGWRLVNAGQPERWHDPSVALWHFAHPAPTASVGGSITVDCAPELCGMSIENHAATAVEAFACGWLLPRLENPQVHAARMAARPISSPFVKLARLRDTGAFGWRARARRRLAFWRQYLGGWVRYGLRRLLGVGCYDRLRHLLHRG